MSVKMMGILLAIAMAVILIAGLMRRYGEPRKIISTGSVRVQGDNSQGPVVIHRTRVVLIGSTRFEEVELPGGSWIDCSGDCAKAAREAAGPDFWEKLRRNTGGH
ncbi:MAG: hypothetical protein JSS20_04905 [Proteobacteria bacterium]|nr:hypothetical protein [Pseudomonadota bacterium]